MVKDIKGFNEISADQVDAMVDGLFAHGTRLRDSGDMKAAGEMLRTGMRMFRNDFQHRIQNRDLREENAKLVETSETDALTGVPNRLGFYKAIQHELAEANRFPEMVIGMAYIDLDGFKEINDTFGHKKGDEMLQEVTRRLQESFRDTDIVCRLGGDEIVIILPYQRRSDFRPDEIAEKVREAMDGLYLWDNGMPQNPGEEFRTPGPYPLGASIGVSSSSEREVRGMQTPEKKMEAMAELADRRMYKDKWRNGQKTDADKHELFHPKNARLETLRARAQLHHDGINLDSSFDFNV